MEISDRYPIDFQTDGGIDKQRDEEQIIREKKTRRLCGNESYRRVCSSENK